MALSQEHKRIHKSISQSDLQMRATAEDMRAMVASSRRSIEEAREAITKANEALARDTQSKNE